MVDFQNFLHPLMILLVLILAGYSIYIYRITNPPVPARVKKFLTLLRILTLAFILFALFNSVISISREEEQKRLNIFFIDNSKSIVSKEKDKRIEDIKKFISAFSGPGTNRFYTFGSAIAPLDKNKLSFNESYTEFDKIPEIIEKEDPRAASVIILSDGIITAGASPIYNFEKMQIPIFTIAAGDSTEQTDIALENPQFSVLTYKNRTTQITAGISNKNLAGKNIPLKLFDGNKLIEQKNIVLSTNGIDNVIFDYTPETSGDKRLTISLPPVTGEVNTGNNSKSFYITVLNDKIKALLVSGSPSPDQALLSEILRKIERIKFKSITEVGKTKNTTGGNSNFPADSADVLILLNYPSRNSDTDFFNKIKTIILTKKIPVLLFTGRGADATRLKELNSILPFTSANLSGEGKNVQVYSDNINNQIIQQNEASLWGMLPPVLIINSEITIKPESNVLLKAKINNSTVPIVITRSFQGNKSETVTIENFWKWKLQPDAKLDNLFDKFIDNSIQWLTFPEVKKNFIIKTGKKVYSSGEKIEITAFLYDQYLNPVENQPISLNIASSAGKSLLPLQYEGNGVYKGEIEKSGKGNLNIRGNVKIFNISYSDSLNIFVDESDIELINTKTDINFLRLAASAGGGECFSIGNYAGLKEKLEKMQSVSSKEIKKSFEIHFASSEIMLIILIILFALEWVIRKIYRLI